MKPSPLGYALIGLAFAEPQTGYALRKVFETSPLGSYSSSPGSIYPALAKLVTAELLEQRPARSGGKPLYHVTTKGSRALTSWLKAPVTLDEIAKDVDHALLRFAFLQSITDTKTSVAFLTSFESAIRQHLSNLKSYMNSPEAQSLSLHGHLAMENGIRGYQAHLLWAHDALEAFQS